MKINAYISPIIKELLASDKRFKIIESEGIISLCNSNVELEGISNDKQDLKVLEKLDFDCEYFVFDIFNETEDVIRGKGIYFLESTLKNRKLDFTYKQLPRTRVNLETFVEAYKTFLNKIVRNIHMKKLILLRYKVNGGSTNKVKVLDEYYKEIEKLTPGIQIIDIEVFFQNDKYIIQDEDEKIINRIVDMCSNGKIFKGEKIHNAIMPIKYYFEEAKHKNKEKLIIVFAAFSTDEAKYNYVTTLKAIDCNKLFVLDDYGTKGTYYIGLDGDMQVETSVMSLISKIMMEYDISFRNVISVGSSKGGTAALYYGLKYNFSNIIAGAPQYRVGTYLCDLSIKDYGREIFGEISDKSRIRYDNLIRNNVSNNRSKIKILTSDGDSQYRRILKEFEYLATELNLNLQLDKCEIKNHGEIAKVFPDYLVDSLGDILEENIINTFIYRNRLVNIYKYLYIKYKRKIGR